MQVDPPAAPSTELDFYVQRLLQNSDKCDAKWERGGLLDWRNRCDDAVRTLWDVRDAASFGRLNLCDAKNKAWLLNNIENRVVRSGLDENDGWHARTACAIRRLPPLPVGSVLWLNAAGSDAFRFYGSPGSHRNIKRCPIVASCVCKASYANDTYRVHADMLQMRIVSEDIHAAPIDAATGCRDIGCIVIGTPFRIEFPSSASDYWLSETDETADPVRIFPCDVVSCTDTDRVRPMPGFRPIRETGDKL